MKEKQTFRLLGICFIILLAVVFTANIFIDDKGFSEEENRVLQEFPEFSFHSYTQGRWEKSMENYANDQFLLRNTFIRLKASTDVTLGQLKSNGVYRCKDKYLMEELTKPDPVLMDNTIRGLSDFRKAHKKLDFYFLLAPNAANIMENKLPATVRVEDQNKYMDQFYKEIKKAGITPVDVRKTFMNHRDETQLYYRTDHHWTTDGAYIAYKEAAKVMKLADKVSYKPYVVKDDFRGTLASKTGFTNGIDDAIKIYMPEKDKDYMNSVIYYHDSKEKTTEFYKLDNLKIKDAYTVFGGSNHPIYTIGTPSKSKEKLLLLKDSYANSMIPFLAQNYRKIVVVDPRYFFDNIEDIIKSEGITQVMCLYNANTFFSDHSLEIMLNS